MTFGANQSYPQLYRVEMENLSPCCIVYPKEIHEAKDDFESHMSYYDPVDLSVFSEAIYLQNQLPKGTIRQVSMIFLSEPVLLKFLL